MNKIFKVIWSKSKQCYIVVSEMAKNHSGKKKIVVASILAAMAVGSGALVTDVSADPVRGGVSLAGGETKTDATIAIGSGSYSDGTAIGGDGSRRVEPGIAIGVNAKAMGNSNVVMGLGSQIIGHSFGVAIGRTAQATDDYGVSVGYNTHADLHGIAMGEQSRAKKTGATSFGVSSRGYGNGAIAVGWQSLAGANVYNENGVPNNDINTDNGKTINDYDKWGDVAIGVRTIATGGNATALGRGATASAANAIAIGGGDGGEPTKDGNTASDNKEKTKATAEKAVAIGYKALASDKSATSIGTDAQATQARATAIGYEVRAVGKNAVAIGSSGENSNRKLNSAGENAISIGTAAQANNNESTAIGKEALASNTNAIALGTGAEGTGNTATAIGYLVKATESNAFAAGSESLASGKNSISIGSTYNSTTNQATGEASIAIGAAAQSKDDGSIALGRNVQVMDKYTTALGVNITASKKASASTIIGYNSYTKANQSVNIGSTVKTEAGGQYSTAIGYTLSVSGKNAIGIGSSDDGITDDKKLMATGESSIAIGTRAQGKATGATAIGKEAVASHTDAIALGTSAQGTGEASTAIGNGAKATNSHAFAAGVGASAAGNSAIAVGNSASAAKDDSVAIGTSTTASEIETVAVGLRASAQGKRSVSVGIDTESTTADGVSVGYLSKSQALGAVAIGRNAVVTAEKSTAVGYDLSITNSGSTNIGYTSTVKANQAISVGARNLVEAGAGYGTALGYFVNISGKNAIGIGSSDDTKNVIASTKNAIAIGTSAQSHGTSGIALGDNAVVGVAEVKDTNGRVTTAAVDAKHGVAIGTNAKVLAGQGSVALGWSTEVNASDVVNSSTDPGATRVSPYLLDNIGEDNSNDKGNGIVAIGTKRTSGGSGFARRLTGVAGAIGDYDAVNLKQLKALESNEWLLRTQNAGDANPTDVEPQTVNNQTKKRVTLKAGDNIGISNSNGVVTLNVTNVVKTVTSGNAAALTVNNNNGAVTITPNIASSVGAVNEDNKLVTSGKVKAALDNKIDKTAEMHIKSGEYTVNTDGTASLIQQNGNNQDQTTRVTIKDIAKKSVVDTLQSDYNTFKTKAITFTGDDNQGVARTLDTTLTVKGGANYTSTTTNTNIRVEKDGTTGLAVKLSDKLTGIKEIAGTGSQDLVIKNGNTTVTVKAPANGDRGTVDFGNAKVVAPNLDASISYKAGNGDTKKTVKLQDGFNFTTATDATTTAEGPKSGLAIKAEDNGKVTFGLDKATREKVDNAADKSLSNLSDDGKNKVKELAKTAAQDAVKVANGINTTVEKDTATAGVTTYKVNANDTTVAVTGDRLAITGGDLGTDKVRKYSLDLSAATKGKLAAVGNLATNVIGGTTIGTDGTVTGPTFSITKADGTAENAGTIKEAIEKLDAANKGQNTKISDTADKVTKLATALGGGAKVENGTFTGPTYNITKDDGSNTKEAVNNVGDAISKLDGRINKANTALGNKGLDFYGNKDAADTDKVHRNLGEALKVKGAENFTREANAKNNIDVVKNTAGDGFDVKLATNLANMKEISGNGKDNLVIKNGDATITLKPKKEAEGTNPATPATVDFGETKVVASNLDANISYKAGNEDTKKKVKLQDGFNFTAATDTTVTAEGPKAGLAITAEDNGKVTFGLDKATREKVDNAADKNLSNLSDTGKNTVKELAKGAAQDAVKVANGINTTVTTDTTTTSGVTTYKVNANDTTVAVTGNGLTISGGDLGTDKVRKYSLDLSDTVKAKLNAINNVGDTASNGRDGVNGTSGAQGLTGKDGLNDKTLTDKVNALRNGEAGSVVYTDENGARLVKAKDGQYYKAADVDKDGNVLNNANPATTVEARVVNPDGTTTGGTTKLSNIADGKVAAGSKDAVNGGQLNTVKFDLATALGGGAKVENGVFTGPTYNITKDDGTGTEAVKNVGDAISKLDGRINNANTVLGNKGLDFYGNKDAADTDKVHRNLGEALKVKGAENFTREANAKNNIDVVKNTAGDGFDVKLAANLANMKEISGNGKDDLVIKNGDATITLKPKKDAEGTNPATPATVDFGNAKVVAPNLEASITYRANNAEDADAKTVTLQKGLNFVSGDGTAATDEAAKAGITIAADKDGKVVFGLNEATRNAIDNAADKNLSNLSQEGKDKVADLAKTAARDAVKVTAGNNVTVTSETKDGNTTYTVNGRDTTVKAADNGSVSVTGGTLNAKGEREYTVDLTADAKAELGKISDLNTRLGSAEGKITTLQGDMTKAKDDIAANTKAIDANKEAIAANKNAIADNARDIAANRKDIDANKQGIAENKKQIGENAKAIAKNAEDIKKNALDIKNNTETIKSNTDRIQTVENRVTTAEGKIATNEKAIKDNASAIQSNTKAIGANTTAIAKNANDITKANKEIESLKGNSATKDLNNLTNTGKDTITNLINVTGEHGITVTPSTDTTTRVKTFTAKLNDTVTFGSGDKKITVDGTTGTVTSKAVAADTVKANTVNAKTVQLGDSTGTNTTVTADGIAVTTKNPDGTTSKVEIKNGTVSGLTNTKWDPAKVVTDADRSVVATQGQVKDVTDSLARGRVFVGDTGKTVTVGLGDTLAIKGGATGPLTDDNIGVVSTEAKDGKPATMTVKLAKDVKMKDGSTSYDYYLPERKTNPDGSKEIVKNADGSVKYQLGKDGNPIRLVTTTVNGEGITIAPVKGLDKPTVSLTADGLDNGGNQIHNVAAGTANTDAATVGQVRAAAHALNNRVNEAGAHAAALAAMNPLSYDPLKKSQVMAGVGSYKGNKALALGVAHYANEDTLFNVGVAVGDGSNMVNAGVTYRFGGEDSAVPERYKGGPISSVYVMQDEVSALKAENAEMKEQMKMLMERIEMLAAK